MIVECSQVWGSWTFDSFLVLSMKSYHLTLWIVLERNPNLVNSEVQNSGFWSHFFKGEGWSLEKFDGTLLRKDKIVKYFLGKGVTNCLKMFNINYGYHLSHRSISLEKFKLRTSSNTQYIQSAIKILSKLIAKHLSVLNQRPFTKSSR